MEMKLHEHLKLSSLLELIADSDYFQKVSCQIIVHKILLQCSKCLLCEIFEVNFIENILELGTNMFQHLMKLTLFFHFLLLVFYINQNLLFLLLHCGKLCFKVLNQNVLSFALSHLNILIHLKFMKL
jgi:hypothetical protein